MAKANSCQQPEWSPVGNYGNSCGKALLPQPTDPSPGASAVKDHGAISLVTSVCAAGRPYIGALRQKVIKRNVNPCYAAVLTEGLGLRRDAA